MCFGSWSQRVQSSAHWPCFWAHCATAVKACGGGISPLGKEKAEKRVFRKTSYQDDFHHVSLLTPGP